MRMKSIVWRKRFILLQLIIPFLLIVSWFRNGLLLGGGDEAFIFHDPEKTYHIAKNTWLGYGTGVPTLVWLSRSSFLYGVWLLQKFFFIPSFILQAGTLFTLMVTGCFSVYFLTKHFLGNYKDRLFTAYLASVFYLLNPFTMSQVWGRGNYAQFFSFALLPLSILLFVYGLEKKKYIFSPLIVIISVLFSSSYGFITFVVNQWVVFFLCAIFYLFLFRTDKRAMRFTILFFCFTLLLWLIAHILWLAPIILTGKSVFASYLSATNENLGTLLGVSLDFPFHVLIRLMQNFYFFRASFYGTMYTNIFFQVLSFLPVLFLSIGFYAVCVKKELRKFTFFVLLFIVGIIISLGANKPFGSIFVWLFNSIPLLQIFRNPYEKFGLVLLLGYAPIFALGFSYLFHHTPKNFLVKRFDRIAVIFFLFIILGILVLPLWSGKAIANPDGNIGVSVPQYYNDLENWLETKKDNYRLVMTPIWDGDGAYYLWNNHRYQGIDPMVFFIDREVIGSSGRSLYYYEFIQNVRSQMGNINIVPAIQLIRAKYLVDRSDAVFVGPGEQQHLSFLTSTVYPLSENPYLVNCGETSIIASNDGTIICQMSKENGNWRGVKYIVISVKTESPAYLDIAVQDENAHFIRWAGRSNGLYQTKNSDWTKIVLPLHTTSGYDQEVELNHIRQLEIKAYLVKDPAQQIGKISVQDILLDKGKKEAIQEFRQIKQFGKLRVFEPISFNAPPELGLLSSIEPVEDFPSLFKSALQERKYLHTKGFVLTSQNTGKDVNRKVKRAGAKITEVAKLSDTRYWMQIQGNEEAYIHLAKSFNPSWKVIPGIDKSKVRDGLINNIQLIFHPGITEDNHFVVNGYANLWKVEAKDKTFEVVFVPQLIADVSREVSIIAVICMVVICFFWIVKPKK